MPDVQELDALEALEHPAHGGAAGRLLELIWDRLASGDQLRAQAMFRQPIDEQAQHHHQTKGHETLGLLDEDGGGEKQRILEKTEATLHTVLLLVRLNELLVRQLGWI